MVYHTNVKQSTRLFQTFRYVFIFPAGVFASTRMVMYDSELRCRCFHQNAHYQPHVYCCPTYATNRNPYFLYHLCSSIQGYHPKFLIRQIPQKRVYKRIYILTATDGVLPVMPALQPFVQFNGSRSHFFTTGRQRGEQPVQIIFPALPFRFGNKLLTVRYLVYQFAVAHVAASTIKQSFHISVFY